MINKPALPPAIMLMGPTASGKTALAIALCKLLPIEIISVDSALVYRDMDIGTAKPNADELAQAPHRLISFLDPGLSYSAAKFRTDALREIANIQSRGNIPLLVGGTMMYFRALLFGMADLPPADAKIRADIEREAEQRGWPALHQALAEVDVVAAQRLEPNDGQRIERALEVYRATGKTLSQWQSEQKNTGSQKDDEPVFADDLSFTPIQMAIAPQQRSVLHQRIEKRFRQMMAQGFKAEVQALYDRGDLNVEMPSVRAVGYRQMWDCVSGKIDESEAIEKGIIATRQLAKRQLTWLRSWQHIHWINTDASGVFALDSAGKAVDKVVASAMTHLKKHQVAQI